VTDASAAAGYDRSVFINCPFDTAYQPMFDAIVFAVLACGHVPHSALEIDDAGRARFVKIAELIGHCRFGIHDISRTDTSSAGGLPRFNMPLELGLFLGAIQYGGDAQRRKQCLVLDSDRTRYRDFISDLSGHDIKAHANDPAQAIGAVRNFLRSASGMALPGGAAVAALHARFTMDLPAILSKVRIELNEMTLADTTTIIFEWLKQQDRSASR
jgi:hypothetical protein